VPKPIEDLVNCYESQGFERTAEFCLTQLTVNDDNF
jgi:hypothetical protein